MHEIRKSAARRIAAAAGLAVDEVMAQLVRPPKPEMGDLGFPCFGLAKARKAPPPRIAAEIARSLEQGAPFQEVKAVGPYVNFTIRLADLAATTAGKALCAAGAWSGSGQGAGRTVVIDYSSPNVAKPLAVHHLRTNVIGGALARLYRAAGWRVVTVNHLGDWGTTFGQLMSAYVREQAAADGEIDVDRLFRLYVRFHAEAAQSDDELRDEEARSWFKRLEDGDPEAVRMWRLFVDAGMKPLRKIYRRLGLRFDHFLGESFFNDKMDEVMDLLRERGLLRESEGALIVDLEKHGMPPCLVRKRDGATTYATRDLAAALYRWREFAFDKCVYVVANQQELHFRQVFKVLELMGCDWVAGCEHVKFGMLALGPGVLGTDETGKALTGATRKGRVVFLEEVLDRACERAQRIILEHAREPEVAAAAAQLAEQVGVGAVVFSEYTQRRNKDIVFTWEKALNLQGDSGPYLQYTHARLCSILRRYGGEVAAGGVPWQRLQSPVERELLLKIGAGGEVLEQALRESEPSLVASHLLELCAAFNRMFTDKTRHRIVGDDEELTRARVALVQALRLVLARGLGLLGLAAPERM